MEPDIGSWSSCSARPRTHFNCRRRQHWREMSFSDIVRAILLTEVDWLFTGKFSVGILPVIKTFRFRSKNRIISSFNAYCIIHVVFCFNHNFDHEILNTRKQQNKYLLVQMHSGLKYKLANIQFIRLDTFFNSGSISLVRNIKRSNSFRTFSSMSMYVRRRLCEQKGF